MIKEPLLIIICILLVIGCYTNYQGWEHCYQNKERIANDLYKMQTEDKIKYSDYTLIKLNAWHYENKVIELEAKLKELRVKK